MDVSIIIVNYNTKTLTQQCINNIIEKTKGIEYEIILVDNASTDGSKEFFEKDKRIKYIYSNKNGGFGYANNLGMKVAKGKYFFLLNSDTLLINNAIEEFYKYAENENKKKLYGCYLKKADGKTNAASYFFFPSFTMKQFLQKTFSKKQCQIFDFKIKDVEAVSGADMFFHREIYEMTKGFDENIFLYGEEGEWQYRMLHYNYHCCIIPQPKIIHYEAKSMKFVPSRAAIKLKSHFYILKKHMWYPTYLLVRFYYTINLTLRNISHLKDPNYKVFFRTLYSFS